MQQSPPKKPNWIQDKDFLLKTLKNKGGCDRDKVDLSKRENLILNQEFLITMQESPSRCLILTATNRLASYLSQQFNAIQKIEILPINHWLEKLWQRTEDGRIILNDRQQQSLWQHIIEQSLHGQLLPTIKTAKLAMESWALIQRYLVDLNALQDYPTQDIQVFLEWAEKFQKICTDQNFITPVELPKLLTEKFNLIKQILPLNIQLCGFDVFTKTLRKFIAILKTNSKVTILSLDPITNNISRIALKDFREEIEVAVRFIKQRWEENPTSQIGCLVPQLLTYRKQIVRTFAQVFQDKIPYNISGGENLVTFPLISSAINAINLNNQSIKIEFISKFLLSSFFQGSQQEFSQRALLDYTLRQNAATHTDLRQVLSLARQSQRPYYCPILAKLLEEYLRLSLYKKTTASQWVKYFSKQLQTLGWPGDRSLNPEEYQLLARWKSLLEEFISLELIESSMTLGKALERLEYLGSNTLFQAETPPDQPIQVLGILEAGGLRFDYCWVMGMNSNEWPPPASPNPFLPIPLQRQLELPHASSQIEMDYAARLTKRFTQSGNEIIFSYSNQGNNKDSFSSTLIKKYSKVTQKHLKLENWQAPAKIIFAQKMPDKMAQLINDNRAPELTEEETPHGGTRILEAQAVCPFKAYAKSRLAAESIPIPSDGLSLTERGKWIHIALAYLWKQIKTYDKLIKLNKLEKKNIINQSIEYALLAITKIKPFPLKSRYYEIEQQRVSEQLNNWLELEIKRTPFQVIAIEESRTTKIGNLTLTLRVDRIDQLENSNFLIIDYKTGKFLVKDWLVDNPTQLQLLIYAVTSDRPIAGITFAQIRSDNIGFYGISKTNINIPTMTITHNWETLQEKWKQILCQLSNDFCQGKAMVRPKSFQVCAQCDLQPLCRINTIKSGT